MDSDVDAYFAQHDIPSIVSDMLFELGFHRPKDVGSFLSSYVDRRFGFEGRASGSRSNDKAQPDVGYNKDTDYSTIEVQTAPASTGGDEARACSLLEEVRALRKKYEEFQPQMRRAAGGDDGPNSKSFVMISWSEFRTDYGRLLQAFSSPQLWTFCERRLTQLRGLFDAHCALNARAEEHEARSQEKPSTRVDTCVQLGRSLPPSRLLGIFKKLSQNEAPAEKGEGARSIGDQAAQLGRPVAATDVTLDADAPPPKADELCGLFARTNQARGGYIAEAALASFRLLDVDSEIDGERYAEFRLPLRPESGVWADLARWVQEFNVRSRRVRWVAQLPEGSYAWLKDRRLVLSYGELLDNCFGPISMAAAAPPPNPFSMDEFEVDEHHDGELEGLLNDVVALEFAEVPGSSGSISWNSPEVERDPKDWTLPQNPPYAYQLYHVWARLKAMNLGRDQSRSEIFLRSAAVSAEAIACAYLLGAQGISRCSSLAAHAPLQYLFVLDELPAAISLSSRRSFGGSSESGARMVRQLFRAGVHVSLCTEDPTVSHQVDNALGLEYSLARSAMGLSEADCMELAHNSLSASAFRSLLEKNEPEATAAGNSSKASAKRQEREPDNSIRQRYRLARRRGELTLLSRLAPRAAAAAGAVPA